MEMEYNINMMSGIYDSHFSMVNALLSFLLLHQNDFVRTETFTIKKAIHADFNGERHFNFVYRGRSYHAYVNETVIMFNGRPQIVGFKVYKVTVLESIWA